MADFVIIGGGKIKKVNGRFGGEGHGRGCDCSYSRRHEKLNARAVRLADLEDLYFADGDKRHTPVAKPDVEYTKRRTERSIARDQRSSSVAAPRVLSHPRAVYHNDVTVTYYGRMRIVSARY